MIKHFFVALSVILLSFVLDSSAQTVSNSSNGAISYGLKVGFIESTFTFKQRSQEVNVAYADISGEPQMDWLTGTKFKDFSMHYGFFFEYSLSSRVGIGVEPTLGTYEWSSEYGNIESGFVVEVPFYIKFNIIETRKISPWVRGGISPAIGGDVNFNNVESIPVVPPRYLYKPTQLVNVDYEHDTRSPNKIFIGAGLTINLNAILTLDLFYSRQMLIVPLLSNAMAQSKTTYNSFGVRVGILK